MTVATTTVLIIFVIAIASLVIYFMKRKKRFRQSNRAIATIMLQSGDINKLDPSRMLEADDHSNTDFKEGANQ